MYRTLATALAACAAAGAGEYRVGDSVSYQSFDVVVPTHGRLVHTWKAEDWTN